MDVVQSNESSVHFRSVVRLQFGWSDIVSREDFRSEFQSIHRGKRLILDESFDLPVAIRSGLFLYVVVEEFQCVEFLDQSSSSKWFLFDLSVEWNGIDTLLDFVSRLVRWRWNQRVFSISLVEWFFPTFIDRLFVGVRLRCLSTEQCWSLSAGHHSRWSRLSDGMDESLSSDRSSLRWSSSFSHDGILLFESVPRSVILQPESKSSGTNSLVTRRGTPTHRWRQSSTGHFKFVNNFLFFVKLFVLDGGVPAASIFISSLDSSPWPSSSPLNLSALERFENELNVQSNLREYLIRFLVDLPVTNNWNSIQIQSTSLAQLTRATNQLTRSFLVRRQHSLLHERRIHFIVECGFESISSLSFGVVFDGTTNSSRRSANVLESTRSMRRKSSHGRNRLLFSSLWESLV